MTEKLKELMHARAAAQDFAAPDLDAMIRAGDRRVRRRRVLTAVGGGVTALALVGLLATQLTGDDRDDDRVAVDPLPTGVLTWSHGQTLHTLDDETDLGHHVRAYVRTADGYVFSDPDGVVWSFTDGEVVRAGQTSATQPRLVSDDEDSLAGWVDSSGDRPAFVVFDQATGETATYDEHTSPGMGHLADQEDPAVFFAIDDGTAYWRDSRGAVAVELDSGAASVVDADAGGFDVIDVENGVIAFFGESGTTIGPSRENGLKIAGPYGARGILSPGAEYYSSDADEPQVFDARTGERVRFDLDYWLAAGYEWLDDETLVMIAARSESAPVELLTCAVPEGACESTVELAPVAELDDFALPGVEHIAD